MLVAAAPAGATFATVYHPDFHGRPTASGKTYRHYSISAASDRWFGRRVTICHKDRCVYSVPVTDTCSGTCEIDLSGGVADQLGVHPNWSGRVRVYPE